MFDRLISGRDTQFAIAPDEGDAEELPVSPALSALSLLRDQLDETRSFIQPPLSSSPGISRHQIAGRRHISGQMDMLAGADSSLNLMLRNICSAQQDTGWPTLHQAIDLDVIPADRRAGVVTLRPSGHLHPLMLRKQVAGWTEDQLFRKLSFRSFSIRVDTSGQLFCQSELLGLRRQSAARGEVLDTPPLFTVIPDSGHQLVSLVAPDGRQRITYPVNMTLSVRRQSLAPVFLLGDDRPGGLRHGPGKLMLHLEFLVEDEDPSDWLITGDRFSVQLILRDESGQFIIFESAEMQLVASRKQNMGQNQMMRAAISLEPVIQSNPEQSFVFILPATAAAV